jgi:hypothetical protein
MRFIPSFLQLIQFLWLLVLFCKILPIPDVIFEFARDPTGKPAE